MVTLCLAGPEAERKFCCSINDGSDRTDYEMAREGLARLIANPLHAAAELARYCDAAQLVRSAWAQQRIRPPTLTNPTCACPSQLELKRFRQTLEYVIAAFELVNP
jgi:hypothetical protein